MLKSLGPSLKWGRTPRVLPDKERGNLQTKLLPLIEKFRGTTPLSLKKPVLIYGNLPILPVTCVHYTWCRFEQFWPLGLYYYNKCMFKTVSTLYFWVHKWYPKTYWSLQGVLYYMWTFEPSISCTPLHVVPHVLGWGGWIFGNPPTGWNLRENPDIMYNIILVHIHTMLHSFLGRVLARPLLNQSYFLSINPPPHPTPPPS